MKDFESRLIAGSEEYEPIPIRLKDLFEYLEEQKNSDVNRKILRWKRLNI